MTPVDQTKIESEKDKQKLCSVYYLMESTQSGNVVTEDTASELTEWIANYPHQILSERLPLMAL